MEGTTEVVIILFRMNQGGSTVVDLYWDKAPPGTPRFITAYAELRDVVAMSVEAGGPRLEGENLAVWDLPVEEVRILLSKSEVGSLSWLVDEAKCDFSTATCR